jgi:hypothetical protein
MAANTTGTDNLAAGAGAMFSNTGGSLNPPPALMPCETIIDYANSGIGAEARYSNTTGFSNIAVGQNAGFNRTTGSNNIDIGNKGVAAESNIIRIGTQGTRKAAFREYQWATPAPSR